MRTLFAKFLVGFWLALALFVGAEVALETRSLNRGLSLGRQRSRQALGLYADLARAELRRGGAAALDSVRTRFASDAGLETFVVDSAAPPARPGARAAGLAALRAGGGVLEEGPGGFFVGYPIGRLGSNSVAIVFHAAPGRRAAGEARGSFLPYDLGMRGLVVLVLGGIGSFLLARTITAPVSRLRDATLRLGRGDLTARVGSSARRRDELEDLGRDFDRMAGRLEALVTAQRRLLGDISHELRSPLARMNVALALLRDRDVPDPDGMISRLEIESGRLNRLIEDLLELSRAESGGSAPATGPVALDALIAEIAGDARLEAGARGCRVQVTRTEPVTVSGARELLRSAIENVVRNAIRYTAPGSDVEIRLERGAPAAPDGVAIVVRDHGPGLPESQLERIFEPFYRADEARGRDSGGTGLGLAIAKRAVAQHGGRITAAAAPGGGLAVTLHLSGRAATRD